MNEFESPKQLLRRIYDEEFGFLPSNASMKPVHLANALARRIVGMSTDHTPLARILRQYVENQRGGFKEERNPNSAILADYGECFRDRFGNAPSDEALTRFRSLTKDTLGADDAVFPTQASFTLSHRRMITADLSDNGAGDFLASLLTAGAPTNVPVAATHLAQVLEWDTDPWTTISWPLLSLGQEREATLGAVAQLRADRFSTLLTINGQSELESLTLRELRARYDQLAAYEQTFGSKLSTLRRLILFGAFVLHVHMIRRCSDVIDSAARPPLLLDLLDGRRRSLREASAATLQAGFRSIEQLVLHRIRRHFEDLCGDNVASYLTDIPAGDETDKVREEYDVQIAGTSPLDALAEAFWKVGYTSVGSSEVRGLPWNSLLGLGRRSGFLLPYDNRGRGGKEHKRYGANAEFAEVLVAATVTPGEPVEFDQFLELLRGSFGIVVGRTADFEIIRRNDLRLAVTLRRSVSVNEGDLRANLTAFRDLLVDIGFAKSYADGRTVVTTDEGRG